jgi:hypothetical protein
LRHSVLVHRPASDMDTFASARDLAVSWSRQFQLQPSDDTSPSSYVHAQVGGQHVEHAVGQAATSLVLKTLTWLASKAPRELANGAFVITPAHFLRHVCTRNCQVWPSQPKSTVWKYTVAVAVAVAIAVDSLPPHAQSRALLHARTLDIRTQKDRVTPSPPTANLTSPPTVCS